jgi:hypothetical protein
MKNCIIFLKPQIYFRPVSGKNELQLLDWPIEECLSVGDRCWFVKLADFFRFNVKYMEQIYGIQPNSVRGTWNLPTGGPGKDSSMPYPV